MPAGFRRHLVGKTLTMFVAVMSLKYSLSVMLFWTTLYIRFYRITNSCRGLCANMTSYINRKYINAISILAISGDNSFWVLFDKIASLYCHLFEKYIQILALKMESPGNWHCASCFGTLLIRIPTKWRSYRGHRFCDVTSPVLPATRQRWHFRPYPSRS